MTETQVQKLKQALAIYRGLPDVERAERLTQYRTFKNDPDGGVRAWAAIIVPYFEKAEMQIQEERRREMAQMKADILQQVRAEYPSAQYETAQQGSGMKVGVLGFIAITGLGVYGVYLLLSAITLQMIGIGIGIFFAFLLGSALLSGNSSSDSAAQTGSNSSSQKAGNTVYFNVNVGDNGNISFEQKSQS